MANANNSSGPRRSETLFTSIGSELIVLDESNALPGPHPPTDIEATRKRCEEYKRRFAEERVREERAKDQS